MSSELVGRHPGNLTQALSSTAQILVEALVPQPTDTIPLQINNPNWRAKLEASIFGSDLDFLLAKTSAKSDRSPSWLQVLLDNGYEPVGIFHESVLTAQLISLNLDKSECAVLHIWPGDLLVQTKGITHRSNFKLVLQIPKSRRSP